MLINWITHRICFKNFLHKLRLNYPVGIIVDSCIVSVNAIGDENVADVDVGHNEQLFFIILYGVLCMM